MDQIEADVSVVLGDSLAKFRPLNGLEIESIVRNIEEKHCGAKHGSGPLWERVAAVGGNEEDMSGVVSGALTGVCGAVFLLINDWRRMTGFEISPGEMVLRIFEEMYKFEWYVTDLDGSFVLCRNDHGIVIYKSGNR